MPNKEYVLITGASSGIGKKTALQLSQKYNVIIHGRNLERLKAVQSLCTANSESLVFGYDLSDVANLEKSLADFTATNQIAVHKFVHCAGYMPMVPLKSVSFEMVTACFNTNVISAALIIKTLNHKKHNQAALNNVVLVSSNISNRGAKAYSIYGASKSGLDGLMRNLAVELAPKVRINSVLPGGVETEMTKAIYQNKELVQKMAATYPLGLGDTSNIADAVEFLLSSKSAWITGQQLTVDGGRTINITG